MDFYVARAAKFSGNGRQMKCVGGFVLKFHMLQRGVVTGGDFRDGIGEIRGVVRGKITLDDRRPAVRLGDDEIARLNRLAALLRGGNENELDGFGDGNSGRHVNKPAVVEKRLIQRGKGVVVCQRALAELFFDEHRIRHHRRRQVRHFHPGRQSAQGRERR